MFLQHDMQTAMAVILVTGEDDEAFVAIVGEAEVGVIGGVVLRIAVDGVSNGLAVVEEGGLKKWNGNHWLFSFRFDDDE